jgi:hypothetical protein
MEVKMQSNVRMKVLDNGKVVATDGSYWKFKTKEAAEAWFDSAGQVEIPLGFLSGEDGAVEVVHPDDGDGEHWEIKLV